MEWDAATRSYACDKCYEELQRKADLWDEHEANQKEGEERMKVYDNHDIEIVSPKVCQIMAERKDTSMQFSILRFERGWYHGEPNSLRAVDNTGKVTFVLKEPQAQVLIEWLKEPVE
jgi:hypothetical protein